MLIKISKEILKGKTLARSLMNFELSKFRLSGKVLDLGAGKNPSYMRFFKKSEDFELVNLDLHANKDNIRLNLEKDKLPYDDYSIDQALLLNLLEHIYNYKFVTAESYRVLKDGGSVIGFVPFFVNIHPDPHDYFRYSKECLEKIFKTTGFKDITIKEIGRGPFAVHFNNIVTIFPKIISLLIFPIFYFIDWILIKLKPNIKKRFPLGYFFVLKK